METAKIIFNDGTELEVEVNGSSYIVDEKPTFPNDLTNIIIELQDLSLTFVKGKIQECTSIDGRYWFTILETPHSEDLESQVFYTAMMTDTIMED